MDSRIVAATVPDTKEAIDTLQGVAAALRSGVGLICLRRPADVEGVALAKAVAECTAVLLRYQINATGQLPAGVELRG